MNRNELLLRLLVEYQLDIVALLKLALRSGDMAEALALAWTIKRIDMRIKAVA